MSLRHIVIAAGLACVIANAPGTVRAEPIVAQIGDDIVTDGGLFGAAVATSSDGTRVAVGAPAESSGGGSVRVYDYDDGLGEWTMTGGEFAGVGGDPEFGFGDHVGTSVDLSADGSRLAIGAPAVRDVETQVGRVAVHEWDGESWRQLGDDITGSGVGDVVSLSADGTRIALGGAGSSRVLEWTGGEWVALGPDIVDDSGPLNGFGQSVELSAAGDRLAVGAPGNPETDPPVAGFVRVFEWDGAAWTQSGTDLVGAPDAALFGWDLAFSQDAERLVVLTLADVDGAETASIFDWDDVDWLRSGVAAGEPDGSWLDTAVAVSADGLRLAIADAADDTLVFDWDGTTWQRTVRLDPGAPIAMARNGGRLALGDPSQGRVRMLELFPGPEGFGLDTTCEGSEDEPERGLLLVTLDDPSLRRYELDVAGLSTGIRESIRVQAEGGGQLVYGPFPDDTYQVVVRPATNSGIEILTDQVTIACSTVPPTTAPTPSSVPTVSTLPATGPARDATTIFGIATAMLIIGSSLQIVRRQRR